MQQIIETKDKCTYPETGTTYREQKWATCYDCFEDSHEGACLHCLETCHAGHAVGEVAVGQFFCDCGAMQMCSRSQQTKKAKVAKPGALSQGVIDSNNTLAVKLFETLPPNSICSPLSIAYILSLLHLGSGGNTEVELTTVLGSKNSIRNLADVFGLFNNDIIKLANTILVNGSKCLQPEFLEMVKDLALVSNEDFKVPAPVVAKANDFIERNTNGLIKDIVKPAHVTADTVCILINTIYFKTVWDSQFKVKHTKKMTFNNGTTNPQVDMMTQVEDFPYFETPAVKVLEMPYKGKEFCMGFILPKDHANLRGCIQYLTKGQRRSREVTVYIPKFTHRKNTGLVPVMQALGVNDLFSGDKCNLDAMSMAAGTYVSDMIHEAVVIVDEAGTEAAAVTVAVCVQESCMMCPPPAVFKADHPFIYYIKHRPSDLILFVGDYHGL